MAILQTTVSEEGSQTALLRVHFEADKLDYVMFEVERVRGLALNEFGDETPLAMQHSVLDGQPPHGFDAWAQRPENTQVTYEFGTPA